MDSCCLFYQRLPKENNLRQNSLSYKMLGGNNGNAMLPVFLDENRFPYPTNASSQLQLFGSGELSVAFASLFFYILRSG